MKLISAITSKLTISTAKLSNNQNAFPTSKEIRKNIEKITIDARGRAVPQLYSKLAASQELRKMLNFGRVDEASSVSRLSDAELIAQLSDTAKELGIKINLNYSFAQPKKQDE
jgi:hypothetical protein